MKKPYNAPTVIVFGNTADITRGKTATGSDSVIGGIPIPGECEVRTDSGDCILFPPV